MVMATNLYLCGMNNQLIKALEAVKSLELAEKHLARVEERLRKAIAELNRLDRIVEKEHQNYEELEKAGLRKIFRNILGKGDEKLEQEKQEYLEAVLEYNQQRREVELLEFERSVLREKVARADEIRAEFKREIDYHSEQMARLDTPEGKELRKIDGELQDHLRVLREVNEALRTGRDTHATISKILQHLERSGWWAGRRKKDNLIKKAFSKIESIDKARKLLPEANNQLNHFVDELRDLYDDPERTFRFNPASFRHFSNGFYDSLITDYILTGKADNAMRVVSSTRDKIEVTLRTLEKRRRELEERIGFLEKRKQTILLKSEH